MLADNNTSFIGENAQQVPGSLMDPFGSQSVSAGGSRLPNTKSAN